MAKKTTTQATASPEKEKGQPQEEPEETTTSETPVEEIPTEEPATTPEPIESIESNTPTESIEQAPITLESLAALVAEHSRQILELQQTLARKRKPVPNGKVQIKDTKTGKTYPSKNGTYKSLLKSGELKDLIAKGIFGDNPEKNTFGWYALEKAMPGRFVEVKENSVETTNADK